MGTNRSYLLRLLSLLCLCSAALSGLLLPTPAGAQPAYTILDLGPVLRRDSAVRINNQGQVAFVFQNRVQRYTDGVGLETLPGFGAHDLHLGMNDFGHITGERIIPDLPSYIAFRYTDGSGVQDLLPTQKSYGAAINNHGDVAVGSSAGYLYTDSAGLQPVVPQAAFVNDINESRQVVGSRGSHAFVYSPDTGVVDLTSLVGGNSEATAINEAGQITGQTRIGATDRAFRASLSGHMHILGNLGSSSEARSINDYGDVVGFFRTGLSATSGFLYTDAGGMVDLDTLIATSPRWRIDQAWGINNAGQIAGIGTFNGTTRVFRLTPTAIPEPGTMALLGSGLLALAARKRRR